MCPIKQANCIGEKFRGDCMCILKQAYLKAQTLQQEANQEEQIRQLQQTNNASERI